jgi:quinol monooxygenase YgiN
MVDITVILTARDPASLPELRELLAAHVSLSRREPGCVRFEAYESQSVAGTFVLIERWESPSALELHRNATGFTTIYAPKVLPLVDRVPYICTAIPGT